MQVKGADGAIAKIADYQGVAERAEVRSGHRHSPRQIHVLVVRDQPLDQISVQVEDVDQPGEGTCIAEAAGPVREIIGDVQPSPIPLDIRRIEARWKIRILESAGHADRLPIAIPGVDSPLGEIRGIESWTRVADADGKARVHRALGAVIDEDHRGSSATSGN